jgi:hypothetical protein
MNEDFEFLAEILDDNEEIKPIELGGGLIEYRKYVWALKFMEEKALKLKAYKQKVLEDIDKSIESKEATIEHLKSEVRKSMLADPSVDSTPTGGKSLELPDIATVSISKLQEKIDIVDPDEVLKALGQEYSVVKVNLDVNKAKKYMKETGVIPKGATKKEERTMSIRFKE